MNTATKMQRARISLLLDEPFFGALLLNLQPVEDRTGQFTKTMATDGQRLYWSTKQVEVWSEPEIKTVLAHEVLHCALLHHLRRGDRDSKAWNVACDHAVNLTLEACNDEARAKGRPVPFEWPKSTPPIMDKAHIGKAAEDIYCAPVDQQGGNGNQQDNGDGMGGVKDDPGAADEAEAGQQEANWKQAVVQAAAAAKGRGSVPASMAKLVEEILNPQPRWQELLRRFITDRASDDYSWFRPNPRYISTGFILPSLYSQRLGTIAIVRDTSGSTQDWQGAILSELSGIISETQPAKVIVIDADAEVQRCLELEASDSLPVDALGGGGTDFRPALARLEDFSPACCIYLTDLDGTFPDCPPSYPVLWATNSQSQSAPFGETIAI